MASAPKTRIATSDEQSITVRGHDLVARLGFGRACRGHDDFSIVAG